MYFLFDDSKRLFLYVAIIKLCPSINRGAAGLAPEAPSEGISLEGFHGSVALPAVSARPWRQYLAFAGPALLVSVGYMDPGNWATDLQAGAQFKYIPPLGGRAVEPDGDLPAGHRRAPRDRDRQGPGPVLPRLPAAWTRWPNYLSCEVAIAACDLAEVLGSAVALHLLFPRLSLLAAVIITSFDVLVLLSLQRFGMRLIEAVVLVLIATIGICYFIEIFVLPQTQPNFPRWPAGSSPPTCPPSSTAGTWSTWPSASSAPP
jgi:manganese transport protein